MSSLNPLQQPAAQSTTVTTKPRNSGRVRWWIVWTLFFSTVINYISRQTFSVLSPMITAQYHLSHTELAKILGSFQVSYAITWLLGGIFLDAVGTRVGLALAVIFWSVVNILTGFANSVFAFASFRFLLGIGEGFNWPAASKTVAEWFPSEERSLAVAIFDSGSSVGGALAALVIPWIALAFGWRWSFVFSRLCVAGDVVARLPPAGPSLEGGAGRESVDPSRPGHAPQFGTARLAALSFAGREP
jgi:MFS transporter, ACS family, hexuronate transporter